MWLQELRLAKKRSVHVSDVIKKKAVTPFIIFNGYGSRNARFKVKLTITLRKLVIFLFELTMIGAR